jgi:glycosyltransferase involved in cell wall biosynthesis
MKILIVQDFLRSGGTERQSVLLANAFAAAGQETTLLTFRPGGALNATVAPAVRRLALQPIDTGLDWFAPRLRTVAAEVAPQVVLCMGRMANCQAGALQRHLPESAVIATMRTGKPLPARFRASLRTVRAIVANSADARDTLVRRYGAPADRIAVIHNSLVFAPLTADGTREDLRRVHGAGPGALVLLCVAMFRPEKNQRELVEIVAGLPTSLDCQLWLVGDGPARRDCEVRARAAGLDSRVRFLGFQRDPSGLYAAADVAVHASASESLSNFLIEAQAHGVPAVVYAAQGMSECFIPGETGWVIARDDRAGFRAALERLAAAPASERTARSDAARAFARTAFDPAQQVRAYLELFARLTAAR